MPSPLFLSFSSISVSFPLFPPRLERKIGKKGRRKKSGKRGKERKWRGVRTCKIKSAIVGDQNEKSGRRAKASRRKLYGTLDCIGRTPFVCSYARSDCTDPPFHVPTRSRCRTEQKGERPNGSGSGYALVEKPPLRSRVRSFT